jgi:thioredoxin-like negative regulator of GroEL
MKEAFARAAKTVSSKNPKIALAAVDCTVERGLAQAHNIKGFPTLKYFKKDVFASDYKGARTEDALATFAVDPDKAEELARQEKKKIADEFDWKSVPGGEAVVKLTSGNFEKLKQVEKAVVMYYAPCELCRMLQ